MIEVQAASLAQVTKGKGGRTIVIDEDVAGIARDLRAVHPDLRLGYNERGEYFVVYQLDREAATGNVTGEHLVTTAVELDQRLLRRVEQVVHPSYNLADEIDRLDKEIDADNARKHHEVAGEKAERLAHAIRKDVFGADTGRYFFKDRGHDL